MSYQELVASDDDIWDCDTKTVYKKSKTNSFRKRFQSVIYLSSLNSNYRSAKASHSLPNSPKKNNVSFFRMNTRKKDDSEVRLIEYGGVENDTLEMQG